MSKFDNAKKKALRKNYKLPVIKIGTYYRVPVLMLPLFPFVYCWDKFHEWNYNRFVWSEERATKVLDKVLPKCLEWVEEDNAYYYSVCWGTSSLWRKASLIDRKWARKFSCKLLDFLEYGYENADYVKTIENEGYDVWVKFIEK